jgi:hypothetical protein
MNQIQNVLSNEYLSGIIYLYLNIEDILNLSMINKKTKNLLGKTWKEICTNEFTSNYIEYSIFDFLINIKIPKRTSFICDSFFIDKINWEQFYKCGKQIIINIKRLVNNELIKFNDDCILFCNYFFSTLKGKFRNLFFIIYIKN